MKCAFGFQLCIMTEIWVLDENRKYRHHIHATLIEVSVKENGENLFIFEMDVFHNLHRQKHSYLSIFTFSNET